MTPKLRAQILKHVKHADTVTDEDCWIWTGARSSGVPAMQYGGGVVGVRRAILLDRGVTMGRYIAAVKCAEPLCVSPGCVHQISRSTRMRMASEQRGFCQALTRRRKISEAARSRWGRLTLEQVHEIRASSDPQRQLAKRYGISQGTVSAIKRREVWKDYGNPFAGLGAL